MPQNYLDLLHPRASPSVHFPPTNYLSLLHTPPRDPLPPGALAGRTQFAAAYNALLPYRQRFSCLNSGSTPASGRRPLYDGREIDIAVLVELAGTCAETGVEASVETIRRAALALAYSNPADDPWRGFLKGWLADAIVATLPSSSDDGVLARICIHGVPCWFISMRDLKAELDAYGVARVRRLRAAMKSLGWRERRAIAWPDLNTWFLQWIDWIGVSAKFNLAWHYAWGGRGGFERIWTGPAAGVGRDGRAAARRCGHS